MKLDSVDIKQVSPMMKQYIEIKKEYKDIILFFRLGDFYEMFFEDATLVSHELELTLTGKNAGLEERIPMCGVPHHSANIYINKLIEKGYRVAICEQTEDPKNVKGIVKREVIEVISKGTVMNGDSLNESDFNYIASVIDFKHSYAISYADISTGFLAVYLINHDDELLIKEIINIGIKEVITDENLNKMTIAILTNQFNIPVYISDAKDEIEEYKILYQSLDDIRHKEVVKHLLLYLNQTQKRSLTHFKEVVIKKSNETLKMDIHTKRNLELVENMRLKSKNYSLLWLLDKTKTTLGSRKMKYWIENPLIDKEEIKSRYNIVAKFLDEFILREDLKKLLYEIYDLERLVGRISYGNVNARDLLQLKTSIKVLPEIKAILNKIDYKKDINPLEDLYNLLDASIYLDPSLTIKEGYLIKEGYNKELDELKSIRFNGKDFIARLEMEEKEKTGIKTLKIGYNRVFGYYIEISKGMVNQIPDNQGWERKQTLSNAERFITPLLKEKEALILGAEEKIINLEYELFINIREQVKPFIKELQEIAEVIASIDSLQSLATIAEENNFVRPNLNDNNIIDIKEARHPVVEALSEIEYVANDIIMDKNTNILLITGPNMSGKSTYMRQMAIISIMAQIGSFVPALEANIPIFDAIYTRIGASDDLVSGQSTFMVEMLEANNAISNAAKNSLILFDELGRGTATYDGMSLAEAILEYIHDNIECKTLFSTHYHELTSLEKSLKHLKNIHVSAIEEEGNITFLHKIKNGAIDRSYGIHVAALAKLPTTVIKRAEILLKKYESSNKKQDYEIQTSFDLEVKEDKKNNYIEEELEKINPLEITPIDAINIIYKLKEDIKKEK